MNDSYTHAQQMALRHPCRIGTQTLHKRLHHQLGPATTMTMSINTGYE